MARSLGKQTGNASPIFTRVSRSFARSADPQDVTVQRKDYPLIASSYLEALANVSLRRLWDIVGNPRMIPVRLTAPSASSGMEAARTLLRTSRREAIEEYRLEFLRNGRFFAEL